MSLQRQTKENTSVNKRSFPREDSEHHALTPHAHRTKDSTLVNAEKGESKLQSMAPEASMNPRGGRQGTTKVLTPETVTTTKL